MYVGASSAIAEISVFVAERGFDCPLVQALLMHYNQHYSSSKRTMHDCFNSSAATVFERNTSYSDA